MTTAGPQRSHMAEHRLDELARGGLAHGFDLALYHGFQHGKGDELCVAPLQGFNAGQSASPRLSFATLNAAPVSS